MTFAGVAAEGAICRRPGVASPKSEWSLLGGFMRRRLVGSFVAVLSLVLAILAAAGSASATAAGLPYARGDQTVATYSYAKAIHETVFVRAPFDSDHDGKRDRIAVDIIRPATPRPASRCR